jgi:hypothetical protein
MAMLSNDQLTELRQAVARESATVPWTKPQINAAVQAIEDWFEANRAALGTAMEAAAPGLFSAAQKRVLVKFSLAQKFAWGG